VLWALSVTVAAARGADLFVSPNGTSSGDGSAARPWDLATALAQPGSVRPGDTIWLRGGLYAIPARGHLLCGLRGTAAAPITVAQYAGERATIDIRGAAQGFFFTTSPNPKGAAYVNFKDFEITDSDPVRTKQRPVAIYVRTSDHLKFINLVVHDTGIAFDFNNEATNTEVYGSLVYYCDDASDPRGFAHGIYIQNTTGWKKAVDNIVFHNSGFGIHAFPHAGDSSLLDVSIVGNIVFQSGLFSAYPPAPDLLVGGDAVAIRPNIEGNLTYRSAPAGFWNQLIGYGAGCRFARVTNNYFVGGTEFTRCAEGLVIQGNTFNGPTAVAGSGSENGMSSFFHRVRRLAARAGFGSAVPGIDRQAFPQNTYADGKPSGVTIVIRKNQYAAGRANIAIYNWERRPVVRVDPSSLLSRGDQFELRSAQDFFGPPVLSGTYDSGPLLVPTSSMGVAAPVGAQKPAGSGPEFLALILLKPTSGVRPGD